MLLLFWGLAFLWQLISGQFFMGLMGTAISRKGDPAVYWLLMVIEAAMIVFLLLR